MTAAAAALRAGVDPDVLATLGERLPNGTAGLPLVVLADLMQRGVPPLGAAEAVSSLAGGGSRASARNRPSETQGRAMVMRYRLWWHTLASLSCFPQQPSHRNVHGCPRHHGRRSAIDRQSTALFLAPSLRFRTPIGSVRARVDLAGPTGGDAHWGEGVDASLGVPGLTHLRLWPSIYRYDGGQVVPDGEEAGTRSGLGVALDLGEAGLWFPRESDTRDARAWGRSAVRMGGGAWIAAGRASLSLSGDRSGGAGACGARRPCSSPSSRRR